jgi:hypothetical protein
MTDLVEIIGIYGQFVYEQVVNFWAQRRVVSRIFIATMVAWILLFIYKAGSLLITVLKINVRTD